MENSQKRARKNVNWTKENVVKFLEEFEKYPCLYDPKNKLYANRHARADAMENFCRSMGMPQLTTDDLKNKINNIRTQLSHELKKIQGGRSGDGADDKAEPIWWFDLAQFLLPHIKQRKSEDTLQDSNDTQDSGTSREDVSEDSCPIFTPRVRKSKTTKSTDDDLKEYNATLSTLHGLKETLQSTTHHKESDFGNMVAKELSEIDDVELLLDVKPEINNVIYKYKKLWINRVKESTFEIVEN